MSWKFEVITIFYDMCFTSTKCFTMSSKFNVITVFYHDKTALHLWSWARDFQFFGKKNQSPVTSNLLSFELAFYLWPCSPIYQLPFLVELNRTLMLHWSTETYIMVNSSEMLISKTLKPWHKSYMHVLYPFVPASTSVQDHWYIGVHFWTTFTQIRSFSMHKMCSAFKFLVVQKIGSIQIWHIYSPLNIILSQLYSIITLKHSTK
jgi:hypothetical protein